MCRKNSLLGLPTHPFPPATTPCPICIRAKFHHPPKGTTLPTSHLTHGEYLHMDFAFWNIPSLRGFTSMLVIIDASTRMLWLFCTASKTPPMQIIQYFFDILAREECSPKIIRVDEDGALARSTDFTDYLIKLRITLDATGGYSSFLNGKVERPHQTLAKIVRAMIINAGHHMNTWCYCAETAADIYWVTYHSALQKSPYEAWYNIKPCISHLRVWGCVVYVQNHQAKKSDDRVTKGFFMGFTKSRLLIHWLDPTTTTVKLACAVYFDEYNTPTSTNDHISPGSILLHDPSSTNLPSTPDYTIDISDHPYLDAPPFDIQLTLPPSGSPIGCTITTCSYNNLPYIETFQRNTQLHKLLLQHGTYNSTYWLLSINNKEFSTAYFSHIFKNTPTTPSPYYHPMYLARRKHTSTRSTYAENRAIFNQIKLSYRPSNITDATPLPIIAPVGNKVLSLPIQPIAPEYIGQLSTNPIATDWKDSLFDNYDKMLRTGTWSAPILRSTIPPDKNLLNSRVSFRVKDTSSPNIYNLQGRTCADGSKQCQFIDFQDSYSPVASIDSIRLLLAIAASKRYTIHVLDISNAFQNSVIFDPSECTYITLPPFYLTWFKSKWPDYQLPSTTPSLLALQCLKSIQGTKDAGLRWYRLLSGHLHEFGMTRSPYDHGIFTWLSSNKPTYLAIETDDILVACDGTNPFLQIKSNLEKLFDVTCSMGTTLRFLNLRLVRSPQGISMDQTQHIQSKVLHEYFNTTSSSAIPKKLYPFPIEASFEKRLFEAAPLTPLALHQHEKTLGASFNSTVGALMHITSISRPDLAYATMRLSGYMSCPNLPIFEALHHTMCYLYHHPHLPIMYPAKPTKSHEHALSTFWAKGHAKYLTSDYGDGLVTFTDADHARCLQT
jgi:hypothetical protein